MIGENIKELTHIEYRGKKYPIEYNLNVAARLQSTFGSQQNWLDLIYPKGDKEPDINALIETCKEFINEGIDIENDDQVSSREFISKKLAGRILSEIGTGAFMNAMSEANDEEEIDEEIDEDDEEIEEESTPSED